MERRLFGSAWGEIKGKSMCVTAREHVVGNRAIKGKSMCVTARECTVEEEEEESNLINLKRSVAWRRRGPAARPLARSTSWVIRYWIEKSSVDPFVHAQPATGTAEGDWKI